MDARRYGPSPSRQKLHRVGEDALAWILLASAAFVGCLLALVAWHALVG